MTISAGCGTGTTSSHNTEADIELDKPSVTITEIIHWVKMYLILRAKRIHQTTVTIGL